MSDQIPMDQYEDPYHYQLRIAYTDLVIQLNPTIPLTYAILLGRIKANKVKYNVYYPETLEKEITQIDNQIIKQFEEPIESS